MIIIIIRKWERIKLAGGLRPAWRFGAPLSEMVGLGCNIMWFQSLAPMPLHPHLLIFIIDYLRIWKKGVYEILAAAIPIIRDLKNEYVFVEMWFVSFLPQ